MLPPDSDDYHLLNINKRYDPPIGDILSQGEETVSFQDILSEKTIIYTKVPKYVLDAIEYNKTEPSDLSIKLCKRSNRSTLTDFIQLFQNEIEERSTRKLSRNRELFNGPICGIISSQLKEVLRLETIDDFLVSNPADVKYNFENVLLQKQRSNVATIVQLFASLESKKLYERSFLNWICTQMCRITLDYKQIGCDENYKCIAQVIRREKKSRKKKEKKYWLLLGNDNDLTICQNNSQFDKDGPPIPVDLFSFTKPEGKKYTEMNIHQFPKTIKTKFEVDIENDKAFDKHLWERGCLRVKKVPFFYSLGYGDDVYHPAYIEAATRAIMCPLAIVLRSIFSYDKEEGNKTIIAPSKSYELFRAFFEVYLYHKRAHEMINVMIVEGLFYAYQWNIDNEIETQTPFFPKTGLYPSIDAKLRSTQKLPPESFLTFFTLFFFEKYSNNYFNSVISKLIIEIDKNDSLADKSVNISVGLLSKFVNKLIREEKEISPQIRHFAAVLQNYAIVNWGRKYPLYALLKEFFFDLYVYRMIRDPRVWDNNFSVSNNNQTAREFIKMFDTLISPDKHFEESYPTFIDKMNVIRDLQNLMFQFIMNLPVLEGGHFYDQEVNNEQEEKAVSHILKTISNDPILFRKLMKNKERRLVETPIFYSLAHFFRCLVSDKQNMGLLDDDDRDAEEIGGEGSD